MFSASEQNLPRFRAVLSFLTIPPHPRLAQQTHILALKQYSIHITVSWHFGYGFNRTFRTLTTNSILIIYIGKFKTTSIDLSSKLLLQSCIFLDVYTYITVETSGQSYTLKFTVIRRESIYQMTMFFAIQSLHRYINGLMHLLLVNLMMSGLIISAQSWVLLSLYYILDKALWNLGH
jgi:hypothetical protein